MNARGKLKNAGGTSSSSSSSSPYDDFFRGFHHRQQQQQQQPETETGAIIITYDEWREQRLLLLTDYLARRIKGLVDEDEDDEDEDDEDEVAAAGVDGGKDLNNNTSTNNAQQTGGIEEDVPGENDTGNDEPETQESSVYQSQQPLETQQDGPWGHSSQQGGDASQEEDKTENVQPQPQPPSHSRRDPFDHIPSIDETSYSVEFVPDLNLYARSFSLALAEVENKLGGDSRVNGGLIETRRRRNRPRGTVRPYDHTYASMPQLPRLKQFGREDGPLGRIYSRKALVLQVRQLNAGGELRKRARNLQESGTATAAISKNRICVFLYNGYAEHFDKILRGNKSKELYVALENVPARCIFPFSASDFYERQHYSDYCICIGDVSLVKRPTDPTVYERFDSDELKIRAGWTRTTSPNVVEEYVLHCDTEGKVTARLEGKSNIHTSNGNSNIGPLAVEYQRWKGPHNNSNNIIENGTRVVESSGRRQQATTASNGGGAGPAAAATATDEHQQEQLNPNKRARCGDHSTNNEGGVNSTTGEAQRRPQQQQPNPTTGKSRLLYERLSNLRGVYESHRCLSSEDRFQKSNDCLTNIYGVVLGFGCPARTKRGDWMCGVSLIDDSLFQPESNDNGGNVPEAEGAHLHAVNINIFTKTRDALPEIHRAGEVLRLHRVKVQEWKDEIQLLGMRFSSYVVYRDPAVGPTAKHQFETTPEDMSRFEQLWSWAQKMFLSHPTMKPSQSFKLSGMNRQGSQDVQVFEADSTKGDLTAMVTAIIPVPDEKRKGHATLRGFLRIWDGTGPPASDPLPQDFVASMDMRNDPPPQAMERIASIVRKMNADNNQPSFQPPKAVTGRVANVVVWDDSHWDLVTKSGAVSVGSFIRLRNVQEDPFLSTGIRCLMLSTMSKGYLTPLPDLTYEVVRLLSDHNDRLVRGDPINPRSGILPLDRNLLRRGAHPQEQQPRSDTTARRQEQQRAAEGEPTDQDQQEDRAASIGSAPGTLGPCNSLKELMFGPPSVPFTGGVRIVNTHPPLPDLHRSERLQPILSSSSGTNGVTSTSYSYRLAVRVSDDESTELLALLPDAAAAAIVGMSATDASCNVSGALFNLHKVVDSNCLWEARIRVVQYNEKRYYLIESMKQMR